VAEVLKRLKWRPKNYRTACGSIQTGNNFGGTSKQKQTKTKTKKQKKQNKQKKKTKLLLRHIFIFKYVGLMLQKGSTPYDSASFHARQWLYSIYIYG
jgi:hypothetical protein